MITLNPVKLNNNITFTNEPKTNNTSTAILSLQSPSAKLGFQKDYTVAKSADAVQQLNPFKAVGYKFIKTYNELTTDSKDKHYPHISFMA